MVPFQLVMRRSSPSSRPYEQASVSSSVALLVRQSTGLIRTSAETLLALLELLQQTEVTGDFGHVVVRAVVVNSRLGCVRATESIKLKSWSKSAKTRVCSVDGHKHSTHQRHRPELGWNVACPPTCLSDKQTGARPPVLRPPSLATHPFE